MINDDLLPYLPSLLETNFELFTKQDLRDLDDTISQLETLSDDEAEETLNNFYILPAENLSFLSHFFDEDCRLFTEQIQSDLGYFQHGAGLLEKAMTAIQGRVDIDQAESDRSLQNTIAIVGVGLGGAGVGISAAPYLFPQEPVQPLLPPFSTNHFHPITQSVLLSLCFGIGFAAVTWIVIYLMQKR